MKRNSYLKTILFYLLIFALLIPNLYAQKNFSDCNRTVNFKEYLSRLPSNFCMPNGYSVARIFNEDINADGIMDRLIKYYKIDWKCADTIFLAVFFGETDTTFTHYKTYSNLYTPMVEQSFKDIEWLVNNCKDDFISLYAWDNQMWLRFSKGQILIPFAVNLWNGYDFYFTYDTSRKNWYLTQKQKWIIPDVEHEMKYEQVSIPEKVENGICIDDFRIKNYLISW